MPEHSIQDLIEEYIYQRQNQIAPDQALQLLFRMQPNLAESERQQLSQMIRQWEINNQAQFTPQDRSSTQPMPPTATGARKQGAPNFIKCPNCQTANPADAKYCYACGQVLTSIAKGDTDHLPEEPQDPALFGNLATLVITVRGYEQNPLRLKIETRPLLIGRSNPSTATIPDIDLSAYGGAENGVSRHHAILRRAQQTITLIDQGSVNHTYINGEKLHPHEVRVIREGDEIRFGRLVTRFTFHRELRRL